MARRALPPSSLHPTAEAPETRADLVNQRVRLAEASNDNVCIVRDYDPRTRIARLQRYSGVILHLQRDRFETIQNETKRREAAARKAIEEASRIAGEAGKEGADGDDDTSSVSLLSLTSGQSKALLRDGDVEEGEEEEEEENSMGQAGKEFLQGEDRYSRIAVKYDAYKNWLKDLRVRRDQRKPGPSILDDVTVIPSHQESSRISDGASIPEFNQEFKSGAAVESDGASTTTHDTFEMNCPIVLSKQGGKYKCAWTAGSSTILSFNKNENPKVVAMRFLTHHVLPLELSECIERFISNSLRPDPSAHWRRAVPPPTSLGAIVNGGAKQENRLSEAEGSSLVPTVTASLTTMEEPDEEEEARRTEERARRGGAPKHHDPRQKLPFEEEFPEKRPIGDDDPCRDSPQMKTFMVLHALRQGIHDKERVQEILSVLLREIAPDKEGARLIVNNRGVPTLLQVAAHYWMEPRFQVLIAMIFHKVLVNGAADANKRSAKSSVRRSTLLTTNISTSLERFRGPQLFVECCVDALRLMAQASAEAAAQGPSRRRTSRSAPLSDEIMKPKIIDLALSLIEEAEDDEEWWHENAPPKKGYKKGEYRANPVVVLSVMRLLAFIVAVRENAAVDRIVKAGGIRVCLRSLQRHTSDHVLLTAALRLLIMCSRTEKTVRFRILDTELPPDPPPRLPKTEVAEPDGVDGSGAITVETHGGKPPMIEGALEPLHPVQLILRIMHQLLNDKQLQLGGTELLKALAEEESGRKALEKIKGGFDWICQGPDEGNILIHFRDGPLHNPGWAIGEQPFVLGTSQDHLLAATAASASGSKDEAKRLFHRSIKADELGAPSVDSIHAHQELAFQHQLKREWTLAEEHFEAAIRRTELDISDAETATPEASRRSPLVTHLTTMTREPPSTLTRTTDHTAKSIATDQRRLAAARVRRGTLVMERNMMHKSRSANAELSTPLELWTPERLLPFLPLELKSPLRQPPPVGSTKPASWEIFDDAALYRVFSVLKRLTLLPNYGEDAPEWRRRLGVFEKETGTPIVGLAAIERDRDFPGTFAFS